MSDPTPSHRPQSWEHLLEKDPYTASGFRLGIVAAVVIHAAIFAITWPTIAQAPPAEPEPVLIPLQLANLAPPDPEPEPMLFEAPPPPIDVPPVISGPPEVRPTEPVRHYQPEAIEIPDNVVFVPPTPVAPPPAVVDPVPTVVRVGVHVRAPRILHKVEPRYTSGAIHVRLEGVVILETIIDTEGRVESVKVLRGLPMGLTESAVDAVKQWRFEPCTLDNRPVAVIYNLTVHFKLA